MIEMCVELLAPVSNFIVPIFYVLLTVHLRIILLINQLNAQSLVL